MNNAKKLEENYRMGKIRERSLQEHSRHQGNISCKMGTINDRNSMNLTEAEDIKKRWQEYTEELCKKNLQDPDENDKNDGCDHPPRARHPGM